MGETPDSLSHAEKRQRANDPSQWPIPAGNRRQPTKKAPERVPFLLAGLVGFEPTNAAVKVLCLTA